MAHFYWLGNDMGYCRERGSLENCNDFHLCEIDFFFLMLLLTVLCLDDAVADFFFFPSTFTLMFAIVFLSDLVLVEGVDLMYSDS